MEPGEPERYLPFSSWWPVGAGALIGVTLRLAFIGHPGGRLDAMSAAFIYLAPLAVSSVTVYLAERRERRSWWYYARAGMAANALCVFGTLLVMIEGLICAIVIVPLFALYGALGGLVMGAVCRLTQWPKQVAGCIAVLPLVLGSLEPGPAPDVVSTIERTRFIAAPAPTVWNQLMDVRDIRPEEVSGAIAFTIGVPPPISAVTRSDPDGDVRRVSMGKHIYFDQVEVEQRAHEYVHWTQRFYADSFPEGAFDQHVIMGGEHFDITDVSYRLTPQGAGTRLTLTMHYRVTTQFNWYADAVARIVLGDLEETLLGVYDSRAAAAGHARVRDGLEQGV